MEEKVSPKLSIEQLEEIANDIREDIIRMLEHAGSGHSAGPMGLADVFTALYFDIMKYDSKNPDWEERDIFLLSNGHCVPVQYATMARAGFFDRKELLTLRQLGSRLQGHPERTKLPGLESTSGPLGCGLSQACGMALAMRMDEHAMEGQPKQTTGKQPEPPRHRHGLPPGASGAAGRLFHAGMDGEFTGQAGDRKNPQHPLRRRGEQQVPPGLPGVPAAPR